MTDAKGHFCEAGVDETPKNSPTLCEPLTQYIFLLLTLTVHSNENLFFKMDSPVQGSSPWKRDVTAGVLPGTFKGAMELMTQLTLMLDPASTFVAQDAIDQANPATKIMAAGENLKSVGTVLDDYYPNFLPDG